MEPTGQQAEVELRARLPKVEPGNTPGNTHLPRLENPRLMELADKGDLELSGEEAFKLDGTSCDEGYWRLEGTIGAGKIRESTWTGESINPYGQQQSQLTHKTKKTMT